MASYRVIQSFDHPCIPNMFMSMRLCQTQIHILINFPSINDYSDDEVLKIFSNLHSTLAKDFLSHQMMRMHRMSSPLTKSD